MLGIPKLAIGKVRLMLSTFDVTRLHWSYEVILDYFVHGCRVGFKENGELWRVR